MVDKMLTVGLTPQLLLGMGYEQAKGSIKQCVVDIERPQSSLSVKPVGLEAPCTVWSHK